MSPDKRTVAGDRLTDLVLEVFRLNGLLLGAAERMASPVGMTAASWQVLGAVLDEPDSVAGIARTMGLARQSVQRLADVLVDEGLAEYQENPAHRRAKLVAPTRAGRAAIRRIGTYQHTWANRVGRAVGARDLAATLEVVRRLVATLEADTHHR